MTSGKDTLKEWKKKNLMITNSIKQQVSSWRGKYDFDCPTKSILIRKERYKINDEVLRLLNVKRDHDDNLRFPFYNIHNTNYIAGYYEAKLNNQGGFKGLKAAAHDFVYPICLPKVKFDHEDKVLHLVETPAQVAEKMSRGENAIAYCYQNKISDRLLHYIISNKVKEIKAHAKIKDRLEKKLNKAGYYEFKIL